MRRLPLVLLAATFPLAVSTSSYASTLYTQPVDNTGNPIASQNDTSEYGDGLFAQVYDDFTLDVGALITGVSFTGAYFNPSEKGPITGWTLGIYADDSGQPGAQVYTTGLVTGTGSETFLGNYGPFPAYTYYLATNFVATGGTTYWLSVVAELFFPQWGWYEGTDGNGSSYQDYFGTRSQRPEDMAFTLNGNPTVPEPASLVLLGLGIMGLGARRWDTRRS